MRLKLILTTAIVGMALVVPSASSAATLPTQDSVVLTGAPAFLGSPTFPSFIIDALNATSGPSGENPTGHVTLSEHGFGISLDGAVTCLAVRGNTATLVVQDPGGGEPPREPATVDVRVVDDQPDTFGFQASTDCSTTPTASATPLATGDITVIDAQPLQPTSKDQCKNGGWRNFPDFKNQGQCIAFVNHGP